MADTSLHESKIGLLVWKTSVFWQTRLRYVLNPYKVSLNEYLILLSLTNLLKNRSNIYQNEISQSVGIDITVTSVTLKSLEKKRFISRRVLNDSRKKIIEILKRGEDIFQIIHPLVEKEEENLFKKLNNETFNFTNSLKLLLGKKIRIKAGNN